jgi:hypothetical protein
MILATINNQFDNIMQSTEITPEVFAKVIGLVKKPLIVPDKSMIPQWKFCTINGQKRCTENIGSTNILILDFDDANYTIQEFENRFKMYKYILHTSHSYDGKNNKFRVLLFLDRSYDINRLFFKCHDKTFSPYHYMLEYFPHIDPASFVKAQFFKMPALKAPGAPYYYNIHNGKLWSPDSIEGFPFAYALCEQKQEEYIRSIDEQNKKKRDPNQDMTKAKEFVKRKLDEMPAGMRHNGVFGLAAWFSGIGGSYEEFRSIPRPAWADKAYDKQISRLANEWYKIGR